MACGCNNKSTKINKENFSNKSYFLSDNWFYIIIILILIIFIINFIKNIV